MNKFTFKNIVQLFKETGKGFIQDDIPKLSASLAYYTIFSIGPMLIVVLFIANIIWRKEALEGRLFGQIKHLVADEVAYQIQEIIKNAAVQGNNKMTALIGLVTLIIAATTVFSEIQDSINSIWKLKVKTNVGWFKTIKTRILSFSLVIGLGFLLLVSLIINGLVEGLMDRLKEIFPEMTIIILYIINLIITTSVTSALFAIIFKVLPDALIEWKDVWVGAVFTAILFMVGRMGIALYIGNSAIASAYGTAGSFVVLLLWIYFSSIILYFGAEFTKCYAVLFGSEILPGKYAFLFHIVQLESKKETVQENENEVKVIKEEIKTEKPNGEDTIK